MKNIYLFIFIFFTNTVYSQKEMISIDFESTESVSMDSIYSFLQQTAIPTFTIGVMGDLRPDWKNDKTQFFLCDSPLSKQHKMWNIQKFVETMSIRSLTDYKIQHSIPIFPYKGYDSVYYANSEYLPFESIADILGNFNDTLNNEIQYWECSRISDKLLCGSILSITKEGTYKYPAPSKKMSKKEESWWRNGYHEKMGLRKSYCITVPVFDRNYQYALVGIVEVDFRSKFKDPEIYIYKREKNKWKRIISYTCEIHYTLMQNDYM